jgi:hypothetical protein
VEFGTLSLGIAKVTKGAVEHSIDFVAWLFQNQLTINPKPATITI